MSVLASTKNWFHNPPACTLTELIKKHYSAMAQLNPSVVFPSSVQTCFGPSKFSGGRASFVSGCCLILMSRCILVPHIRRIEVKVDTVPCGNMIYVQDNMSLGQLPKRLVIDCVDSDALNGFPLS
jgi:hypothetical protein